MFTTYPAVSSRPARETAVPPATKPVPLIVNASAEACVPDPGEMDVTVGGGGGGFTVKLTFENAVEAPDKETVTQQYVPSGASEGIMTLPVSVVLLDTLT